MKSLQRWYQNRRARYTAFFGDKNLEAAATWWILSVPFVAVIIGIVFGWPMMHVLTISSRTMTMYEPSSDAWKTAHFLHWIGLIGLNISIVFVLAYACLATYKLVTLIMKRWRDPHSLYGSRL